MEYEANIQGQLRIYRYAILAVTVTAFTISLYMPVSITAGVNNTTNLTIGDVFIPSLIVTGAALLAGVVSYFVYAWIAKNSQPKKRSYYL